jgi:putative SOS response-associated peptidase YedK
MENGFPYFTILTREPFGELSRIHDRMPLLLPENVLGEWINPNIDADTIKEIASSALTDMIFVLSVISTSISFCNIYRQYRQSIGFSTRYISAACLRE